MLKKSMFLGAMIVMTAGFANANQADNKYLTIGSVEATLIEDVELDTTSTFAQAIGAGDCSGAGLKRFADLDLLDQVKNPLDPINEFEMKLDQIINIGKKIWKIVEAGKPVVSYKTDVATAMPQGAGCWTDLQNWSAPRSQSWGVSYKNLYGVEVVKHVYRVSYLPGGSVNGAGKYIGYASVVPVELNVAWGYKFEATVNVPTVFNMGSAEAPKAGMQIDVNWKVNTVLKSVESTDSYFVSGTGEMQKMK